MGAEEHQRKRPEVQRITCNLNHLQKIADGEPLGGTKASAEEDFADFDEEDDDFLG